LQSDKSRSYLFLLLVVVLTGLSIWQFTVRPFNYGLDVKGGVRFVFEMDTSELTPEQRQNLSEVRSNVLGVLERRVSAALGVVEGTVQSKGLDQFIVELPGYADVDEARNTLRTSAQIRFYHAKTVNSPRTDFRRYSIGSSESDSNNPFVSFIRTSDGKEILPGTPEYEEMIRSWGEPILAGSDLADARGEVIQGRIVPQMFFSEEGSKKMEQWSRQFFNQQENIAAVLDGTVLSIAPVQQGTILRDNAYISGDFQPAYVRNLTEMLRSGALPVQLTELSSSRIDPAIGEQALDMMVRAGIISFFLIAIYLVVYYRFPGIVAAIALVLYVLFTLTVLKMIGATFSLAAIAGFILSIGMAVDANILVFERLKEELRAGKSLSAATNLGFKRALPAIIDSNACTILTSLVLFNLGTGPVKGFATTLIIGVLISLFTAITVTRSLLLFLVGSGLGNNPNQYGLSMQWFGEKLEQNADSKPIRVTQNSKKFLLFILLPVILAGVFIGVGGLKPNVEFQGGFEAEYSMEGQPRTTAEIRRTLQNNGITSANVKISAETNSAILTIPRTEELSALATNSPDQVRQQIAKLSGFTVERELSFTDVGPTVQQETVRNAVLAVIVASLLIVGYLAVRFGWGVGGFLTGLRFGISATLATTINVIAVLGVAAIMGMTLSWEISALFISAMLTVIGYSVHDTIVVFDRIRENLQRPRQGDSIGIIMDRSVTQSLARSINTSLTVIVPLIILLIWGTATIDLKFFILAMLVGITYGTYSSLFNAVPILYVWDQLIYKTKGHAKTLLGQAEAHRERNRLISQAISQEQARQYVTAGGYGQIRRRRGVDERKRDESEEN
jgi:SecD/SecF fusion protein